MKEINLMNKSELINYIKELQPLLRWNFEQFTERELKEVILMHFSN